MASSHPINELLQKRMDRKDFLKHLAIGTAVVTGATGIVKLLKPSQSFPSGLTSGLSYGASAYGGARPQLGK
jgi:hypothetical protein